MKYVFSERYIPVMFEVLEEIEMVHLETKERYKTCHITVSINKEQVKYIPLPM
jgi:hypothetical protein